MSGKRRFVWGTTVFLLILACSAVTVFAADAETEYVPGMYATFWSLIPPVVAIGAGADHKRGLQFPVYRDPDRRCILCGI